MDNKLKKYVEEQYKKVKKQKKSPKNFDIFLEDGMFGIGPASISNAAKASYEGNLNTLYEIIQEGGTVVKKEVVAIKQTTKAVTINLPPSPTISIIDHVSTFSSFQQEWIPKLKALLAVDMQYCSYKELDITYKNIITEKQYKEIINWIKQ